MDGKFDLAVIGGGPGGYEAAIRASQLGLKVAVIEEREMGGTCLNRGCIPTKSLLHSAEVYQIAKQSKDFGVITDKVDFDYKRIASRKDTVVKKLRSGVEFLVKSNGVSTIRGRGAIKDKNTIEISGGDCNTITCDKIIIASGSVPFVPPIPGLEGDKVLTSDEVLNLTECPDKVVIIGGGVIGTEFATIFNSLGKEATIIEMMDRILPGVDLEISQMLRRSMERRGIKIYTDSKVTSVKSAANAVCYFDHGGRELTADGDIVISAVGRRANTRDLGLEAVGVETEKGYIKVNDYMETTVKGIYAIGDATGRIMLAHVASAQGLAAAANAAGQSKKMDYSVVPSCVYTNPEIASVGLTEEAALEKGLDIKVGKFPISANGRSMIMGEHGGLVKIITDSKTGEILGTHIMGPRATDMISEICVAMKLESTIEEVADTIHPHPTISEIIMEAAHDVEGMCINKPGT